MARSLALISAGVLMAAISGCSHNETSSSNTGYPPPATPTQSQQAAAQTNAANPGSSEATTAGQSGTGTTAEMSTNEMSGKPSRSEVRQVQAALNQSGERVKVDGKWGPRTSQALRDYQQKNGLQASGQLDDATMQKLNIRTSG